ncbi:hypothetical protein IFM89_019940 [Coptis chinensis]|uniref:Rx N-terminal domain-containing protein n=1 Tax=Coptis chinensis TaxID=261450 RepID=A0A835I013_9MAGN|nr:hypothetical protein IFM89_019940 [Coptis chinensis]
MAQAILSALMDQLASIIRIEIEQEVVGVREELENLETKLHLVKAVLEDAEKKEIHDNAVKVWLGQLKDVMYDAEDVLDEWNTRILISANGPHVANKVRRSYLLSLCACFKHVGVRHAIAHRIKGIVKRLDGIARNKDPLRLVQSHSHGEPRQLTSSVVDVSVICGRDLDKQRNPSIYEAKKLRTLGFVARSSDEEEIRRMEGVLENLEPHKSSLERLLIGNYVGFTVPPWMMLVEESVLSNITYLELFQCPNLKVLPALGKLQFLEELWLHDLSAVKHLGTDLLRVGNGDSTSSSSSSSSVVLFPKLKEFHLIGLPEWEEGEHDVPTTIDNTTIMPRLDFLAIGNCPKLKVVPHYLFAPLLEYLSLFGNVGVLSKSLMSLTNNNNLKSLDILESPHSFPPKD